PAGHAPEEENIGLEAVIGDLDNPLFDLMTEGDEDGGKRHGHEATGDEHERGDALTGGVPFGADIVEDGRSKGAAESLHEGSHQAHAAEQRHQHGGADRLQRTDMTGVEV